MWISWRKKTEKGVGAQEWDSSVSQEFVAISKKACNDGWLFRYVAVDQF